MRRTINMVTCSCSSGSAQNKTVAFNLQIMLMGGQVRPGRVRVSFDMHSQNGSPQQMIKQIQAQNVYLSRNAHKLLEFMKMAKFHYIAVQWTRCHLGAMQFWNEQKKIFIYLFCCFLLIFLFKYTMSFSNYVLIEGLTDAKPSFRYLCPSVDNTPHAFSSQIKLYNIYFLQLKFYNCSIFFDFALVSPSR